MRATMLAATHHLEAGEAAEAEALLEDVLRVEPGHAQALSFRKQIREDPVAVLGRESFAYRVQPGESLSAIAARFLRDPFLFFALARYNDIKVPRQLAGGQTIRVPGRAPAPQAAPVAAPAPTRPPAAAPAAPAPAPAPAPGPASAPAPAPAGAPPPAPASSPAPTPRETARLIAEHTRAARTCRARQDLCCEVANWDKVLELAPDHSTAKLERGKALELIERLRSRGGKLDC